MIRGRAARVAAPIALALGVAAAQAPPRPRVATSASASASPAPAASAALPAGHPAIDGDLPPGHPPATGASPHGAVPDAIPENGVRLDETLPTGTLVVEVRTAEGAPVVDQEVTLGIVENSVAKGESRRHVSQRTSGAGDATFTGLSTASDMAYRASVVRDGASSAAPPFNAPQKGGMRARLHVFRVAKSVRDVQLAVQGMLFVELRDEVFQIEQGYRLYNLGETAWVPDDAQATLPGGAKAFSAQKTMSGVTFDGASGAAKLRGTIAPGMHEASFRFQLPNDGDEEVAFDLGLLPNVQSYRIVVEAPKGLALTVDGFPPAILTDSQSGAKVLFTERSLPRLDPSFQRVRVRLSGLAARPQGHRWALGLALAALVAGVGFAWTQRRSKGVVLDADELAQAKTRLLDALVALEGAKDAGEIGPKTYTREREALLTALARLLTLAGDAEAAGGLARPAE